MTNIREPTIARENITIDNATKEESIRLWTKSVMDVSGLKEIPCDMLNDIQKLNNERTYFTQPHNDEELSAGAALFISDQLMKTKKGEVISSTKPKIQSKEIDYGQGI